MISLHTAWGPFHFPILFFLATDLTVRVFGAKESAVDHLYRDGSALIEVSYIVSVVFYNGQYQGLVH